MLTDIKELWPSISTVLTVPHTEEDYERLLVIMEQLCRDIETDGAHPLDSLLELVGVLIDKYESDHFPEVDARFPR